jgi:hypothetical protein
MFLSANDLEFSGDHLDLSFNSTGQWTDSGWDMRSLSFAVGDEERGPMVGFFSIPTKPGDEEKFPPIIHMHRSDSFRTIFNGDFYVGRTIYADGEARLQAAGAYYGPEQPGPGVIQNSGTVWSVLVFGDKRGFKVQPADKKYIKEHEHAEEALAPVFGKLGIRETLPEESGGESHIETNIDLPLKAGHADLGFDPSASWPLAGVSRVVAVALSNADCGPIVLGIDTPAGETALPAAAWDTEMVLTVIAGSCEIGGASYKSGDVRIQKSGRAQAAVRAGAGGLQAYVVLGDRRGGQARAQDADAAGLASELNALTRPFGCARVALDA